MALGTSIIDRSPNPIPSGSGSRSDAEAFYARPLAQLQSSLVNRRYEIQVVQHPERALAAGMSQQSLSRIPMIPALILQLHVFENGRELLRREYTSEMPYYVCIANLVTSSSESATQTLDIVESQGGPLQALLGQAVADARPAYDLTGEETTFFIFDDLSLRMPGIYRLRIRLSQALPDAPILAETTTDDFEVTDFESYSGGPDRAITRLSEHLRAQGVDLYFPPLT